MNLRLSMNFSNFSISFKIFGIFENMLIEMLITQPNTVVTVKIEIPTSVMDLVSNIRNSSAKIRKYISEIRMDTLRELLGFRFGLNRVAQNPMFWYTYCVYCNTFNRPDIVVIH